MQQPFILGTVLVMALVVSCVSQDQSEVNESPAADSIDASGERGHGGPPEWPQPVQVVPGNYISPAGLPEAYQRGLEAAEAEQSRAVFTGEVNGIRLQTYEEWISGTGAICGGGDIVGFVEYEGRVPGLL
jgi:hypothetical protein